MGDRRETVGFFCRWGLLGLAGLTVLGVAATAVLATAAITSDLDAASIVPDIIRQSDKPGGALRIGRSSIGQPYGMTSWFVHWPGRGCGFVTCNSHRQLVMRVDGTAEVGLHRLAITGVPYGPFAFERTDVLFQVVWPGREVFLFDARAAGRALRDGPDTLAGCVTEMHRRGEVAFFHAGPLSDFSAVRRRLRRFDARIPVLCTVAKDSGAMNTIRHAAGALNRRGKAKPLLRVVTGDVRIAEGALRLGFRVHLVASPAPPAGGGARLRLHESLAKFKESLAGEPIPKT